VECDRPYELLQPISRRHQIGIGKNDNPVLRLQSSERSEHIVDLLDGPRGLARNDQLDTPTSAAHDGLKRGERRVGLRFHRENNPVAGVNLSEQGIEKIGQPYARALYRDNDCRRWWIGNGGERAHRQSVADHPVGRQ